MQFYPLKDVSSEEALQSGLVGVGMYFKDVDGRWYQTRGTLGYGIKVDVTRLCSANTPADAYANPVDALNAVSLLSGWNGTTWDRLATCPTPAPLGALQVGNQFKQNYDMVTLSAKTTSADSGAITGFGSFQSAAYQLNVTVVSGTTPTLDVYIDFTIDDTNWINLAHFTQVIAAARRWTFISKNSNPATFTDYDATADQGAAAHLPFLGNTQRVRWVIGGTDTPTFTFGVTAILQ